MRGLKQDHILVVTEIRIGTHIELMAKPSPQGSTGQLGGEIKDPRPAGLLTEIHSKTSAERTSAPGIVPGIRDTGTKGLLPSRSSKQKPKTQNQQETPSLRICLCGSPAAQRQEPACDAGDGGLNSGWGRPPGGRHGNPLQYSCLEDPLTEEPGGLQSMGSQRVRPD